MPMKSSSPRMASLRDTGDAGDAGDMGAPPQRISQEVTLGLRNTCTGRGHIAEKAGMDINDFDEEEEEDQVRLKAIHDHSQVKKNRGCLQCLQPVNKFRSFVNGKMHYHKNLFYQGQIGPIRHPFPCLRRIVSGRRWDVPWSEDESSFFENATAALILSNCIVIGWQAELRNPEGTTATINFILEHAFTFLFTAELVIRAIVFNWTFWFDRDSHLDMFLVSTSILNSWILSPAGIEADFLRKATVLRILRLVRIAKTFRRQFKEMWQLLRGLVDCFETLFWTFVLLSCVLYFFAITATTLFSQMEIFDGDETTKAIVADNFSDVLLSMMTLWQIMTLDSWTGIVRPLMKVQMWSVFFFIVFVTVCDFMVMNLITSVIVTETFKRGREDQAEMAAERAAEQEAALKEIEGIFKDMDQDGGGTLSENELQDAWKSRRVRQKFRTMDIGKKDLIMLWTCLDDGDGELTIEEFTNGMRKLKGEAKAKDILKLYREVKILESSIKEITILADYSKDRMNNIKMKLRTTFRELDATRRTLSRVKEHARLASKSQPLCV